MYTYFICLHLPQSFFEFLKLEKKYWHGLYPLFIYKKKYLKIGYYLKTSSFTK